VMLWQAGDAKMLLWREFVMPQVEELSYHAINNLIP